MSFLLEKLEVYRIAVDFADDVVAVCDRLPWRSRVLVDQLSRAAISVPANIAESNGRRWPRERCQYLCIARGSLLECVPLLEIARRRSLIDSEAHADLMSLAERISRMLSGLIARHAAAK